jgi:hypothetical protein
VRASGSFCGSRQPSLGPVIAPSQAQNPSFIAIVRANNKSLLHSPAFCLFTPSLLTPLHMSLAQHTTGKEQHPKGMLGSGTLSCITGRHQLHCRAFGPVVSRGSLPCLEANPLY